MAPRDLPNLTLSKVVETYGTFAANSVVAHRFRASNSGNVPLINVFVADTSNGNGAAIALLGEPILTIGDAVPLTDSADSSGNGTWAMLVLRGAIVLTANYAVVQGGTGCS